MISVACSVFVRQREIADGCAQGSQVCVSAITAEGKFVNEVCQWQ